MNPPQVYMCSPSWTLLPPPSPRGRRVWKMTEVHSFMGLRACRISKVQASQPPWEPLLSENPLPQKVVIPSLFMHACQIASVMSLYNVMDCVAHQAPLSVAISRQEYWHGLPYSSPRNLPNPWIEPTSLMSPALPGGFFSTADRKSTRLNSSHL